MKKLLSLTLTAALLLAAQPPLLIKGVAKGLHPLPVESLSQESGGTLTAEQAYTDGVGVMMVDPVGTETTDYSTLNDLVLKHGSAATAAGLPLRDYVLTEGSAEDKAKAELLVATFVEPDLSGVLTLYNGTLYCNGATPGSTLVEELDVPDVDGDGVKDTYYVAIGVADIKTKITSGLPANNICTSKVNNMSRLFSYNSSFNQDISSWDTSNVTTMSQMFMSATAFNNGEAPGLSGKPLNWNTGSVTTMYQMFYNADSFNQPINFNTSKVTTISGMFADTNKFNQLLNFDTSNVTDMSNLVSKTNAFNKSINNFVILNNVNVKNMFYDAAAYNNGGESFSPIISQATDLSSLFLRATAFNQPLNIDTSNVTNMSQMFYAAKSFNQPINFDTSNVINMSQMFYAADSFNQPINFDTSKVESMQSMFLGAIAFNSPININTSNVIDMSNMFQSATTFNQPVNFDTGNVTNMASMFFRAKAFNQPVNFDTKNVTNMTSMFAGVYYDPIIVFNKTINFTDTSKVTSMKGMFSYSQGFNNGGQPLNLSTKNVLDMGSMFSSAKSFNQDISHWCVPNIGTKPINFDSSSSFVDQTALQPQWGTCPAQ